MRSKELPSTEDEGMKQNNNPEIHLFQKSICSTASFFTVNSLHDSST